MAFDLDDEELKATREMPCNKKNYKLKEETMSIEKAIEILKELKKNECGELLNCWDYGTEESDAIEIILAAYKNTKADLYESNNCISDLLDIIKYKEKIIDKMLDTFIGLDSDIEIVRQHARINTQEKKQEVLKMYEIKCNDK